MKNEYKLNISEPCQENWKNMEPSQVGKFCNLCSKNVIDFSHLSDNEVIRLIESSKGNLCGRLNQNQLNRPLIETKSTPVNPRFHQILAGLLLITNPNSISAQTENKTHIIQEKTLQNVAEESPQDDSLFHQFSGVIYMPDSITLCSNAKILLRNTEIKSITSNKGTFSFQIPDLYIKDIMKFEINFEDQIYSLIIYSSQIKENQKLILNKENEEIFIVGEVIEIRKIKTPKKKKWKFWKK